MSIQLTGDADECTQRTVSRKKFGKATPPTRSIPINHMIPNTATVLFNRCTRTTAGGQKSKTPKPGITETTRAKAPHRRRTWTMKATSGEKMAAKQPSEAASVVMKKDGSGFQKHHVFWMVM
jgi:hypothetical protein